MTQHFNFKVTVIDQNGKKVSFGLKSGMVLVQQRAEMQKYSDEYLKVSLIVFPSAKLQTRARFSSKFVQTSHALLQDTDPIKSPNDWLGMSDEQVSKTIKHRKWRIKTRKGKNK